MCEECIGDHHKQSRIENSTQEENEGGLGGGVYVEESSATLVRCEILKNCTFGDNGPGAGGGVFIYDSQVIVKDCTLSENISGDGAGMGCWKAYLHVLDCSFGDNVGQVRNPDVLPGIRAEGGGALISTSTASIVSSLFYNNSSTFGDQIQIIHSDDMENT